MKPTKINNKGTPWSVAIPARWTNDGKRKAKYFKNKEDALTFCKLCKERGPAALTQYIAPIPKTEAQQWESRIRWAMKELNGNPSLIDDAIEHFKLTRLNVKPATVREAVEAFQAFRRTDVSKRTVQSDGPRLAKLMNFEAFSEIQLSAVTKSQLLEFFQTINKGNRRSVYKSVRVFFGWAHDCGYLGQNPMETIDSKKMGEFGIKNEHYPIATFGKMLRIAAGLEPAGEEEKPTHDFIDLLPWFVISGFGGLRSCEAFRTNLKRDSLKWSDLYFAGVDEPNIQLTETVAKGGRPRPVDMAPALEAIKAWLPFCPREGKYIVRYTSKKIENLKAQFTKRTGIKFLENGFRNSFATYALSYSTLSGLGHVAKQMGNSEAICKRHYAQNLPTGAGKRWFDLRPFEVVPAITAAV